MGMNNLNFRNKPYSKGELTKTSVDKDPFKQFSAWFDIAAHSALEEPSAMVLATVDNDGKPSSRVVLLKNFDKNGFVFYTNYRSKKGFQIEENPSVSLLFFWAKLERQIRIEGIAEKIDEVSSKRYFDLRPEGSRISAIISPQSREIPERKYLEENFEKFEKEHISKPDFWGGYIVKPNYFEFWQARKDRLHDRISYQLEKGEWKLKRLAP